MSKVILSEIVVTLNKDGELHRIAFIPDNEKTNYGDLMYHIGNRLLGHVRCSFEPSELTPIAGATEQLIKKAMALFP